MIQRKKKKILWITIIAVIVAIIAGGSIYFISNNDNQQEKVGEQLDFSSKRLIVTTNGELEETYNAKSANKLYTGEYLVKYETEEEARNAYENFRKNDQIKSVKVDADIDVSLQKVTTQTIIQNIGGIEVESWGIYAMGLNETQDTINAKTTANEIVVAVIDTGFDLNLPILTEQNLTGRIDDRYINVTDSNNQKDIADKSSEKDEETGETIIIGHGTHVGGTILDGTPDNVKILPIKCEDSDGNMLLPYVSAALQYAIDQDVDVINLSLGWDVNEDQSGTTDTVNTLIQEANTKGITVVAAAGNGDENGNRVDGANIYPAAYENVLGVAALATDKIVVTQQEVDGKTTNIIDADSYLEAKNSTAENLSYTSFSNYGVTIDFAAPGKYILSLLPTDSQLSDFPILDGTSMASPHIAAAVATIKSYNKELTNDEVYEILQYYTEDLGTEGRDNDYGEGMPCFRNYTECTCDCETCNEIYCSGCSCATCLYNTQVEKTLTGITIKTKPNKLEYTEGEIFDPTGMVVEAVYNDGTTELVTGYTYEPTRELTTNDTKVTISYKEGEVTQTEELTITVNEKVVEPPAKTLTGIEIKTGPNKTTYTEGEKFDPTGMVVEAVYDGAPREIVTDYTYEPTGNLSKTDTKITITYEGKTAELTITVNEKVVEPPAKTLTGIEIKTGPNKTTYTEGEKFDPTGMEVEAVYDGAPNKVVTNYTYEPTRELTTNDTKVIISYTENEVTKTAEITITVNEKVVEPPTKTLTGIEIKTTPNKTTYTEGEVFNPTGMVVEAVYSDGSRKTITNYNCFPVNALTTSHNKVTVSYTENGKTVTKDFPITVQAKNADNGNSNNQGDISNQGGNKNPGNSNNSNIGNMIQIKDENTTIDNTTKDGNIAYTGLENYVIPGIIIVIAIGAITLKKYKEYKDI